MKAGRKRFTLCSSITIDDVVQTSMWKPNSSAILSIICLFASNKWWTHSILSSAIEVDRLSCLCILQNPCSHLRTTHPILRWPGVKMVCYHQQAVSFSTPPCPQKILTFMPLANDIICFAANNGLTVSTQWETLLQLRETEVYW